VLFNKVKRAIRITLGSYPSVFFPLARFGKEGDRAAVDRETDCVIEGFPRSGNSFAVAAFRLAQPRPARLAHHFHAPAQIIAAARHGIPILVLIRQPKAAVSSLAIRQPYISIAMALREYLGFYAAILPLRDRFVVGSFEEVTTDFGKVMQKVNHAFSANFSPFVHNEANVKKVFEMIEAHNRKHHGGVIVESRIARPSHEREKQKAELSRQFETKKCRLLVAEAEAMFHEFARPAQSFTIGQTLELA
jgi:hypothetical protein